LDKQLRTIEPKAERAVEAVSDAAGFRHREPPKTPPKRRRGTTGQLHNLTMRLAIDDAERFIRWCEKERRIPGRFCSAGGWKRRGLAAFRLRSSARRFLHRRASPIRTRTQRRRGPSTRRAGSGASRPQGSDADALLAHRNPKGSSVTGEAYRTFGLWQHVAFFSFTTVRSRSGSRTSVRPCSTASSYCELGDE
jgi:hypothetical protein